MHFELLQSITLNGNIAKPNDDRLGLGARLAWVVDGATDLGAPGLLGTQGGAAWLAGAASTGFASAAAGSVEETCEAVFARIEAQFHAEKKREIDAPWEVPKAAFAAAQLTEDGLGVAWAADCPVLKISKNGDAVWCTGEPDTSAEAEDARALGAGIGSQAVRSPGVLADRRAHRGRPDHSALSALAEGSNRSTLYAHFEIVMGDELVLMSDGFASIVTDYQKYSATDLAREIRAAGLSPIAAEIRAIEAEDAACLEFPRFKVSDDTTALWVRVAG